MTSFERERLDIPLREYKTLRAMLEREMQRHSDRDLESALTHLEATYILRLYAAFKDILRRRVRLSANEGELVPLVQRLVGESQVADLLFPHDPITYWRFFRRDRNALAHGNAPFPLVSIGPTFNLMETFLREVAP